MSKRPDILMNRVKESITEVDGLDISDLAKEAECAERLAIVRDAIALHTLNVATDPATPQIQAADAEGFYHRIRGNVNSNGYNTTINSLGSITSSETRQAFYDALTQAELLFTHRLNIALPSIEQLQAVGVDLPRLASSYEEMKINNLEPQIVLAPFITKDEAEALYSSLTNDSTIPNNPLKKHETDNGYSDGLYIVDRITDTTWNDLHDPVRNPLIRSDGMTRPVYTDTTGRRWTLSVIVGNTKDIDNVSSLDTHLGQLHTSEYFALQALRIYTGYNPVDGLVGMNGQSYDNSGMVNTLLGFWNSELGQVCMLLSSQNPAWR